MTKLWRYVLAVVLLGAAFALRAPFLSREIWNLDEGSTFTMGVQVRHGAVLYRDAADNRTPLVPYLKAAIFAVAGDWNATAVHIVVALLLGACAVGLWQLGRRLGEEAAGAAAAALFTLLSSALIGVHESQAAHTEWFLLFFSVPAYVLFAWWHDRPAFLRGLAVGGLFGLAALCKQPGLLDLGVTLVIGALLAWARPQQRTSYFRLIVGELTGLALVLGATFAYFAANDALGDFIAYAWTYNTKVYVPEVPPLERWSYGRLSFLLAWDFSPAVLVLALGGALALLARAFGGLRRKPADIAVLPWLILGWSASGIVSTMLSGRAFTHYAICAIPGLSLAGGWGFIRLVTWARRRGISLRLTVGGAIAAALGFLALNVGRQISKLQLTDDFPAADRAVVQQFTRADDRILVWGYLPEFHFYTQRLPNTRFVYSVFLTGMIPWTNTDPLVDTSYAVVPGAWEKFWQDFRRNPPPLIIDTTAQRQQGKYAPSSRPDLWRELQENYVRITPAGVRNSANVFYLRSERGSLSSPAAPVAGVDPTLDFQVALSPERLRTLELRCTVPAGTTRVELLRNDTAFRAVAPIAKAPSACDVTFPLPLGEVSGEFRIGCSGPTGERAGPGRSLAADLAKLTRQRAIGPVLHFAGRDLAPRDAQTLGGAPEPLGSRPGWLTHAPSFLVYERLPAMTQLQLEYGVKDEAWSDPSHPSTNGVDVLVDFEPDEGPAQRLFSRRLNPKGNGAHQGPQHSTVAIPGHAPGRVVLRFAPGPYYEASFDWSWWGRLEATADGPLVAFGDRTFGPVQQSAAEGKMSHLADGYWLAHAPARVVFPYIRGLHQLKIRYGLLPESYADTRRDKTDGVGARVSLEHADGKIETLFTRHLDPAKNAGDRGTQESTVTIPYVDYRSLVVELDRGPHNNGAYDWSYFEEFSAVGCGPHIDLGHGRAIVPLWSDENQRGPMTRDLTEDRYGAHAPSEVTYARPAELAAVEFGFGLFEGSYFDEKGNPKTDGIDAVVEFARADGVWQELFRRGLTPATRAADRGLQRARVTLPPGESGTIRIRLTAGPSGSNAFDWAYLTDFRGELAP